MARLRLSDRAEALLASSLTLSDTAVAVQAGQGAAFPTVEAPHFAYCWLYDAAGHYEEVKVTAHAAGADAFTVVRGQGGTSARSWAGGDGFELRLSKAGLDCFVQQADLQDGAETYASTVGGSGDAITLGFTPPIEAYVPGQTLSFTAAAVNTGAVTVNVDGLGVKPLTRLDGGALLAEDITAGRAVHMTYSGGWFLANLGELSRNNPRTVVGQLLLADAPTTDGSATRKDYVEARMINAYNEARGYSVQRGLVPVGGEMVVTSGVSGPVVGSVVSSADIGATVAGTYLVKGWWQGNLSFYYFVERIA